MKESTSVSVSLTLGRGQDARTWVNCFVEYSLAQLKIATDPA